LHAGRAGSYLAAIVILAGLVLYAYRALPGRPFAADDYEWLLKVNGLSGGQLAQRAFDPLAQQHFYRPLVWLLLWGEVRLFGLDPRGFHMLSLGLHMLNTLLAGWLAARIVARDDRHGIEQRSRTEPLALGSWLSVLGSAVLRLWGFGFFAVCSLFFVALHPAPFEAVVWISAQSELLAAMLLLAALHLWLPRSQRAQQPARWPILAATAVLGCAMLAKESAALGLVLMILLAWRGWRALLAPLALTGAFMGLQLYVSQVNSVLRAGQYSLGPQLVTNPLRSLALIAAPLPGTEHADAGWLVPAGAAVLLALCAVVVWQLLSRRARHRPGAGPEAQPGAGSSSIIRATLALLLTLAPTAPFTSPPDSRYLYLAVVFTGILLGLCVHAAGATQAARSKAGRLVGAGAMAVALVVAAGFASGELTAREGRFAAGAGPGGSLWRLAGKICADVRPQRMILVDPPIAPPHAAAIVQLSCGDRTRAVLVARAQADAAARPDSVVIAFPGGSATVERWV
jgi:hypothetical protein